jgi:hypothetical protein
MSETFSSSGFRSRRCFSGVSGERNTLPVGRAMVSSLLHRAEFAARRRVARPRARCAARPPAHGDPVVADGVLGDDLALEAGEGVREQRHAPASRLPARPAKRPAPGGVARFAKRSCRRPSTLTPKRPARRMRDHVSELRDGQNDTSGGSSETARRRLRSTPRACRPAPPWRRDAGGEPAGRGAKGARVGRRRGVGIGREHHLNGATPLRLGRRGHVVVGAVGAERMHEGAGR